MAEVDRDYAYEAALKFINRVRKEMGKRPLKNIKRGHRGNHNWCAISMSVIGPDPKTSREYAWTGTGTLYIKDMRTKKNYKFKVPRDVARFIRKFDKKKYPGLLRRESKWYSGVGK